MTTLKSLPSEVIDTVLCYSDISFDDIINFRCVCKHFRWAAKTEEYCFLKKKFSQRWPNAKKYYDKQSKKNERKTLKENDQGNKRRLGFIETGIDYVRQLRNCNDTIQIMFEHDMRKDYRQLSSSRDKSNFEEIFDLTRKIENYVKLLFYMDEIKHLLTQPPPIGYDLTKKYYYVKLFDWLKKDWRDKILTKFEEQSDTEFFEQSATILAQQLQFEKDVFYSSIKASLDNIALQVLNFLRGKHPNHSIFSTPAEYFFRWKENNIDDNYWNEAEGIQIMYALTEYIFNNLNFQNIKREELEYMCIDYVLENKCGHILILYIIFQSVARRLGLRCDIVTIFNRASHLTCIKLFWFSEYINIHILDNKKYEINRQYGGIIRYLKDSFDIFPGWIIEEWINKDFNELIYKKPTLKKLLEIIMEEDFECDDDLTDSSLLGLDDSIISLLEIYIPGTRPQEVKFSVGMIVTHGDQSTDCSTGVIIGWHQIISDKFKIIHGISKCVMPLNICSNFSTDTEQTSTSLTHYIILTKNHKMCYVKEDDITLTRPKWIENIKIYYWFHKFENTHYVPNEMLEIVYPDDAAVTAKTIFKN